MPDPCHRPPGTGGLVTLPRSGSTGTHDESAFHRPVLTATRESLHRAAEHLLAAAHKRATGQITLVPADNGVATPPLPDGSLVAIEGTDVVVRGPSQVRRAPLTTLAETAATVGSSEAGFPWTKHRPGTDFEPDAELAVDPAAAAALARWFAVGAGALTTLAAEMSAEGRAHRRSSRSTSTWALPPAPSTTASRPATPRSDALRLRRAARGPDRRRLLERAVRRLPHLA